MNNDLSILKLNQIENQKRKLKMKNDFKMQIENENQN